MRILHITPSVAGRSYGLGQIAVNLQKAQRELGEDSVIWCLDSEAEKLAVVEEWRLTPDTVRTFGRVGPEIMGCSTDLLRTARAEGRYFDVVHQHGIWTGLSYVTKTLATGMGRPTVVAPHGSLEPSALAKSSWKKRVASSLYERANLKSASCLHATAEPEVGEFRRYGLTNPIALIRNGVTDEWLALRGDGERFRDRYAIPADRRILLFMSRIAPKKGLPMLLKAWAALEARRSRWVLVIIGGDEDGHKKECEHLASQLGLKNSVRFLDPIFGQAKRDPFAAADLFVLPTHSEGFPMVVLESLGAGVPAIVTEGAPWRDLEVHGCGWWVATNAEGIRGALESAMDLPPEKLREMGAAGRSFVASRYKWRQMAQQTIELYSWLLKKDAKPEFVSAA